MGIDVFFTFPSPVSTPPWSGVSGLSKLFGSPAIRLLAAAERTRLAATIPRSRDGAGAAVAFQQDAYEGLRTSLLLPTQLPMFAGSDWIRSAAGCLVRYSLACTATAAGPHAMFRRVLMKHAVAIAGTGPSHQLATATCLASD